MITNGKIIESINEKIAILKNYIHQSGYLGHLNVNKHCEGFVRDLLNIIYSYDLKSLPKSNFPGIDIADESNGVAYQVTSDNGSTKVNHTLDQCIKNEHYKKYPRINIFLLSERQGTYTITIGTEPHFTFDWKINIIDFDFLLKEIQNLPFKKQQEVAKYLEEQLPSLNTVLTTGVTPTEELSTNNLLNPQIGMANNGMTSYYHETFHISLPNAQLSKRELYNKLFEFYSNNAHRVLLLPILHKPWEKSPQANSGVIFNTGIQRGSVSNVFSEMAMEINENNIRCEHVEYTDNTPMLATLSFSVKALISLIYFFHQQTSVDELPVIIDFTLTSNCPVLFNLVNSPLSIKQPFSSHKLLDNNYSKRYEIKAINDRSLLKLMQQILEAFEQTEHNHLSDHRFLDLNENDAILVLHDFKIGLGISTN